MPNGFGEGLKGAILGVTVGIVLSAILQAVPSPYKELIEIGNLIQSITILESFEHMGTGYLSG
jgi:ABC-type lipoprotein release transport system permease subunit